jgi:hypothetical protein
MKFKKGDKVRFLNEKGEGIIMRITHGGQVAHVDVDGFEIPFSMSELVPAYSTDNPPPTRPVSPITPEQEVITEDEPSRILPRYESISEGVFLAVVPIDEKQLLTSALNLYLVNATGYHILYTSSVKVQSGFRVMSQGKLEAGGEALVQKIQRADLEKYAQVKNDVIFFSDDPYDHQPPVSELVKLRVVKFYKESTYADNPFFDRKAYIIPISGYEEAAQHQDYNESFRKQDIARMILEKERKPNKRSASKPINTGVIEEEIDLHIEELVDDFRGMSNTEIITIQLNHFRNKLEEAIGGHVRKITFIHGVGNGRLKHEVRRILGTYEGIRFQDAPYSRYGFGATEVFIR